MKDNYDVVVIGAGIGGLTAGALLARKGLSVAVFEAQPKPGGYCTGFKRMGYAFDACLDAVSGCGEDGWLRRVLKRLTVEDEVDFVRLDPLRVDCFGSDWITIPGNLSELMELLYSLAPDEKDGIRGLLSTMDTIYRTAMVTTPETIYNDPRMDGRGGPLSKYRRLTYKDLLDDYVKGKRVRAVMSDRSAFMGLPPSKVSAVAMTIMFMTYAVGGGYRIKDGAENLAKAIVSGLRKYGGELFLNSPVTEIMRHGGRASGVVAGGNWVSAKAVVSAVDAANTYKMAGLEMTPSGLKPSVSFFMVYLGLDKDVGLPDSMGCYPGYDIERTFADVATDIASPNASMEITNYSRISRSMAPAGCSSVMLMSKAAYGYKDDWMTCKAREMDRMIEYAGRTAPGLKESIAFSDAATPLTLRRYTGNSAGAAFGFEQGVGNKRPGPCTALPGLYMAGHWTYPGGGVESVAASGIIAAEAAASGL
jgi:prolycopene isomerase